MTKSSLFLIGIDGNEANVTQRVGSNSYAWQLLKALANYLQRNPLFAVRVYLSTPPLSDLPAARPGWEYRVLPPPKMWTQWRLPIELFQHQDLQLFFSPGHYLPSISPIPTVATIMDLAYERFPDQFRTKDLWQLRLLTRASVHQAKHLFAISQATRQDLHDLYGQPLEKVTVAYPAATANSSSSANMELTIKNWGIDKPYFLYIGTLQPRKNLVRLISAYNEFRSSGHSAQLVLAGKVGWLSEGIVAAHDASPYASDIILTGYVSESEKNSLMRGALATILVGLYEGFGMPPLESIILGTLPIVSASASLPEIVGTDYPLIVDPTSVSAIAEVLTKVVNASDHQKQLWLGQAKQQASQFSWENTAKIVAETLSRLVEPLPVRL